MVLDFALWIFEGVKGTHDHGQVVALHKLEEVGEGVSVEIVWEAELAVIAIQESEQIADGI